MVDILQAGSVYTTFGFEPFTPNNELRYKTFQIQDNFTWNRGNHDAHVRRDCPALPVGERVLPRLAERLRLQLARRLLHRRERLPGEPEPHRARRSRCAASRCATTTSPARRSRSSRSTVWYAGLYAQDEWQAGPRVKLTAGVRLDVPFFDDTGFTNANADALTFRDENGGPVQYQSAKLPDANILWSPACGLQLGRDGRRARPRSAAARASSPDRRPTSGSPTRSATLACSRASSGRQHEDPPVEPEPERLQADGT